MYTLYLYKGIVIKDSDGLQVSPCTSETDPKFVEYVNWVNQGNQPTIVDDFEEVFNA